MRKHTEISVMNTLDKFGYRELNELQKLLFAYMNNGSWNNGKWYADLPSTWEDNGVYPEFNANSGLVFLSNSNYQALILTEFGVAEWYSTGYAGHEGTLFDLSEQVISDLTDTQGNPTPAGAGAWHKDDLNQVYDWLCICHNDFDNTEADTSDFEKARDLIIKGFILDKLPDTADAFRESNEDHLLQLENSVNATQYDATMNNGNADAGWYETDLADGFLGECLEDFEHKETLDTDQRAHYAEFIRSEMLVYLTAN